VNIRFRKHLFTGRYLATDFSAGSAIAVASHYVTILTQSVNIIYMNTATVYSKEIEDTGK
jgi:hypothetical protein